MGRPSDKIAPSGLTEDRALAIALAALGGEPVVDVMDTLDAPDAEVEPADAIDELIIELHQLGKTDRQMVEHPDMPIKRAAVGKRRDRLGLPPHYSGPRPRVRVVKDRAWWERQDRSIHGMILDGYSDGETARTLGVSPAYVRSSRLKQGLRRNARQAPDKKRMNGAESEQAYEVIKAMWQDGKKDAEIAQHLGLREQAVRIRRNNLGLPAHRKPWRPMSPESIALGEKITELHATGMTDRQMAEQLGLPVARVADKRWRMDLPVNRAYKQGV